MLFYLGQDLMFRIDQCLDRIRRSEGTLPAGIEHQSFVSLPVDDTPVNISPKLHTWGVRDFKSIFSRGLGLNAVLTEAPAREAVSNNFMGTHFRYADQLFLQPRRPMRSISV